MKTKTFGLVALLAIAGLALVGCNKTQAPEEQNMEIANPASVYCEENNGTLFIENDEEGNQAGLCMFEDGSYCEEWAYYRNECQPGEIMYNTVDNIIGMPNPAAVYCTEQGGEPIINEDEEGNQYGICRFADGSEVDEWEYYRANHTTPELYSEEDLAAAEAAIMNVVNNEWEVAVESFKVVYAGDETAANNLEYCKSLNAEVTGCAVFTSSFHIPEQDIQMAGAFEPNADIEGWSWTLGKNAAGEWEVLSNGFG